MLQTSPACCTLLVVNDSAAPEFRGAHFQIIAAALACLLSAVPNAAPARAGSLSIELQRFNGAPQPAFALPDTAGAEIALANAQGQVVLVHFFATWCEPCREELPALNRLAARGRDSIRIVAISVAEVDPRVRRFLETMPLAFPVLLDRDRAVAKSWGVATLPTTFVLDANLRPQFLIESDFAWDSVSPDGLAAMMATKPNVPASHSKDNMSTTPKGG